MQSRKVNLFFIVLVWSLILLFFFVFLTPSNDLQDFIGQIPYGEKISHALAFGYLMFQFSLMSPGELNRKKIFFLLLTMGVGLEFLQEFTPNRGFESDDVLANILGLILGYFLSVLVCFLMTKNKVTSPPRSVSEGK
jgi:VanZ family protein